MNPRVLVTRKLLPEAHDFLDRDLDVEIGAEGRDLTREELLDKIRDKDGLLSLLVDDIDREVIESAPKLKVIANCAAGYNNIDLGSAAEKGILVTNTPGVLTDTTADLTWALLLAAARRLPQADRFAREGRFEGWALDLFLGRDITGKCLGIVGMGRIGRAVALRARAFRMETLYFDPHPLSSKEERELEVAHAPLETLLERADFVTLHVNLTPETRGLNRGEPTGPDEAERRPGQRVARPGGG